LSRLAQKTPPLIKEIDQVKGGGLFYKATMNFIEGDLEK